MTNWDCYIIGVQTNASEMIEENENHIATISQCSQTEIPSDNDTSFCTEEKISSEEEEEVEKENERLKGSAFIVSLVLPFDPFSALSYLFCTSNNRQSYHNRFSRLY